MDTSKSAEVVPPSVPQTRGFVHPRIPLGYPGILLVEDPFVTPTTDELCRLEKFASYGDKEQIVVYQYEDAAGNVVTEPRKLASLV